MKKGKRDARETAPPRTVAEIRIAYELDPSHPRFVSVTTCDLDDDTLLHRAVFRGDRRDVKDLLTLGADVNAHGDMGHTPLHYAAMQGHLDLAGLLLAAGANPKAPNEWGDSPTKSAEVAGHNDVARLLRSPRRRQREVRG
ncbi:MAG: hypothetical protein DI570_23405 [Phenylobacterium zucineum]|nr:MAG: hypothetical protein DI570_23405 [Phenylobacterium zucineum]